MFPPFQWRPQLLAPEPAAARSRSVAAAEDTATVERVWAVQRPWRIHGAKKQRWPFSHVLVTSTCSSISICKRVDLLSTVVLNCIDLFICKRTFSQALPCLSAWYLMLSWFTVFPETKRKLLRRSTWATALPLGESWWSKATQNWYLNHPTSNRMAHVSVSFISDVIQLYTDMGLHKLRKAL